MFYADLWIMRKWQIDSSESPLRFVDSIVFLFAVVRIISTGFPLGRGCRLGWRQVSLEGEKDGLRSRFVGKHESLGKVQEFGGTISGKVDGTPYAGDFKEEPHGSHDHKVIALVLTPMD